MVFASPPVLSTATYIRLVLVVRVQELVPAARFAVETELEPSDGGGGGEGEGGGGEGGSGDGDGGGGQPGVAPTLPPPCRQLPHVLATWFCAEQACRCKLEHVLPPIPGLSKWYALHVNVVEVKIVTEPAP